ncbi:MAG: aldehyde dehydrogenase (NADP(+)) [Pirellulaceae bacterium]
MTRHKVLIAGEWRDSSGTQTFRAEDPVSMLPLADEYPVSDWADCEAALQAADDAARQLRQVPVDVLARFLELYAEKIDQTKELLVETAHIETALPKSPRLADVELPRTTHQLRQAAAAAHEGSWRMAVIDTRNNIRSGYVALGPVCVFGPNNFPFAFGSISGGDFAAAIAAGNPVIAKANTSHPGTTRLLAELAHSAARNTHLPPGTIQLLYRTSHQDGERLVSDRRTGATGYTGSRSAGLKLKAAADAAGKPIYLELSSVNPVVILPGALHERPEKIAEEFTTSCLMGSGQFCTNPGLVVLLAGAESESFIQSVARRFGQAPIGTLLSRGTRQQLEQSLAELQQAGARVVGETVCVGGRGYCSPNTLLQVDGDRFLEQAEALQTEAFGNASLVVLARDLDQACQVIDHLEGNLTGCVYSDTEGRDDTAYQRIAEHLRPRVGRLLNDKMPTGVTVSPAMNHGGPYPATGHPGFTAVGLPAAMVRFAMLQCYDQVRADRLPGWLQDKTPNGMMWRYVDGRWTQADAVR